MNELFAQIIEQVEDAHDRIERELKLLSQHITWMYDDGKITYDAGIEILEKVKEIAEKL